MGIDGTTNVVSGMFIVANAAIGCGTLAFSNAFKEAGGLYVGIVMVFVSRTSVHSFIMPETILKVDLATGRHDGGPARRT